MIIYANGRYLLENDATISVTDRGFLLGDGLFETMLAVNGKIECYPQHYRRFESSSVIMNISLPENKNSILLIIKELLKRNDLQKKHAAIRLTLTRGCGPRGIVAPATSNPTLIIQTMPYAPSHSPISVMTSSYQTHNIPPLCHMKHLGYQIQILAKQEAKAKGFDDALLFNQNDFLVSTTCSTVFAVINEEIITPPLKDGCLPGIVRGLLIKLARNKAISLNVKSLSKSQMHQIDGLFLSNSLTGLQLVHQLDNKNLLTDHPSFLSLKEAYQEFQYTENQRLQ